MKRLKEWMIENEIKTASCPFLMSCALAGGNWNDVVHPMLKDIFEKEDEIVLKIIKFNK